MNKDFLIELTKNLYRLTLLFPKKEPLRYKMREVVDDILADLVKLSAETRYQLIEKKNTEPCSLADFEALDAFFEVAKAQNWVSQDDVLAVQNEYAILKKELEKIRSEENEDIKGHPNLFEADNSQPIEEQPEKTETEEKKESPLNEVQLPVFLQAANFERQEKILAFLKEQGRAQVWQIKQVLPEVTKRTLRRDFDNLLKKGLVERIGERNNTFYQLKIVQI